MNKNQVLTKALCISLAVLSILTFFSCSNILQGEKGTVSLDISGLTSAMSGVQAFSRAAATSNLSFVVTATSGNSYNQTQTIDMTTGDMAKYESAGSDTLATFSDIAIGTKVDLSGDIYLYLNKGTADEKKYHILTGSTSVTVDKASNTAALKLSYVTSWLQSTTNVADVADVPGLTNIWISEQRDTTYYIEAHNKEQTDFDSYITKVNETVKWSDGTREEAGSVISCTFISKSDMFLTLKVGYDKNNKAISVSVIRTIPEIYSVSYDANSATEGTAPASQTKTQGTALTLQGNTGSLVRTGYVFSGWNTKADGSGVDYAAGASYATDGAIVLYAKWMFIPVGSVYSTGIKIGNLERLSKTSEIVVIKQGTTAQISMTDDSAWSTYYSGTETTYKGVFLKDRNVKLSSFVMSQYEVTQELYNTVIGSNPSNYNGSSGKEAAAGETQNMRPVEKVSWFSAIAFCNELTKKTLGESYCVYYSDSELTILYTVANASSNSLPYVDMSKKGYRLPTEAEWEFAARGGDTSSAVWTYPFAGVQKATDGDISTAADENIATVAWYQDVSSTITHEVGLKISNTLNLFDMNGNVFEWCWDWINSDATINDSLYTVEGVVVNPLGATSVSYRVIRGGAWNSNSNVSSVSYRSCNITSGTYANVGFRIVRGL